VKTFNELQEVIRIRSDDVPTNYMDLLLLENKTKTLSALLQEFQMYAREVGYKAFDSLSYLHQHLKYRKDRGWIFSYSGNPEDPIVTLTGFRSAEWENFAEMKMIKLRTWAGRSEFKYTGSVKEGTEIIFGKGNKVTVTSNHYSALIRHFAGNTVDIGTSRDMPTVGSLGVWLQNNVTKSAIASYVGPILIEEGYAEKIEGSQIRIKSL